MTFRLLQLDQVIFSWNNLIRSFLSNPWSPCFQFFIFQLFRWICIIFIRLKSCSSVLLYLFLFPLFFLFYFLSLLKTFTIDTASTCNFDYLFLTLLFFKVVLITMRYTSLLFILSQHNSCNYRSLMVLNKFVHLLIKIYGTMFSLLHTFVPFTFFVIHLELVFFLRFWKLFCVNHKY